MIFRTVFRETCSSRQISLIVLPRTKNSRRTLAIVSTPFIPHPPIQFKGRAGLLELTKGGQFWTPIPPLRGSTFHADPQRRADFANDVLADRLPDAIMKR